MPDFSSAHHPFKMSVAMAYQTGCLHCITGFLFLSGKSSPEKNLPGMVLLVWKIIATCLIFCSFETLKKPTHNMKKFEELKTLVASVEEDIDKFYNKQNGAAGTRLRKAMQDLKSLAQEIRMEVQETKNKAQ
jgi:hypothetical protein